MNNSLFNFDRKPVCDQKLAITTGIKTITLSALAAYTTAPVVNLGILFAAKPGEI
ncbi:MAG: hypothetical protein ACI9LO_003094 [Planctomycetota bacterium]|jgi:hypothetical protein